MISSPLYWWGNGSRGRLIHLLNVTQQLNSSCGFQSKSIWFEAMWLATRTANDHFFIKVFPTMHWHCHSPPSLTAFSCNSPFFTVVLDALFPNTHLPVQSAIQCLSLCLWDKVLGISPTALYSNSPGKTIQAGTHSRPWAFVSLSPSWNPCSLLLIELLLVLHGGYVR